MEVAILIERFAPDAGGAERSTAQIARELGDRGHRVTLLAGQCPDEQAVEGVTIVAMARGSSSSVLRLLRFRRWARRRLAQLGPDVSLSIHTAIPADVIQPRGGTMRETLARNVAMRGGMGRRFLKRLSLLLSPKHQVLLWLERQTLKPPSPKADRPAPRLVAVSEYVRDQLQRGYHVPPERIDLIPNAAAMPRVSAEREAAWRRRVRAGFLVEEEAVVYLFAAQNPRLKGFPTLMRATRRLVEQGRHPIVLLAGKADYPQQAEAVRLGLRGHVRFVRHTRRMPALYAAADVTVLPTWYDPSSKVVIESLMMGRPAISTRCNGASDFIEPGEHDRPLPPRGRVVDRAGDVEALTAAMADLADAQERQRCAEATRGLDETLSMRRHVDRLEQVLQQAATRE